jgi:hypothetical protein
MTSRNGGGNQEARDRSTRSDDANGILTIREDGLALAGLEDPLSSWTWCSSLMVAGPGELPHGQAPLYTCRHVDRPAS